MLFTIIPVNVGGCLIPMILAITRQGGEWTIGNFIDEITNLLRTETSAYSAAKRINVPDNYRPRKPEG